MFYRTIGDGYVHRLILTKPDPSHVELSPEESKDGAYSKTDTADGRSLVYPTVDYPKSASKGTVHLSSKLSCFYFCAPILCLFRFYRDETTRKQQYMCGVFARGGGIRLCFHLENGGRTIARVRVYFVLLRSLFLLMLLLVCFLDSNNSKFRSLALSRSTNVHSR